MKSISMKNIIAAATLLSLLSACAPEKSGASGEAEATEPFLVPVDTRVLFDRKECIPKTDAGTDDDENPQVCVTVYASVPQTGVQWLDEALLRAYVTFAADELAVTSPDDLNGAFERVYDDLGKEWRGYDDERVYKLESELLHQRGRFASFITVRTTYLGGVHGMRSVSYETADLQTHKILTPADIVLPGKEQALDDLLQQAYDRYIRENGFEPGEEFNALLSHKSLFAAKAELRDFTFEKDGLVFHYSPYDINAYAFGEQSLIIYWWELRDVLRPEYLWH